MSAWIITLEIFPVTNFKWVVSNSSIECRPTISTKKIRPCTETFIVCVEIRILLWFVFLVLLLLLGLEFAMLGLIEHRVFVVVLIVRVRCGPLLPGTFIIMKLAMKMLLKELFLFFGVASKPLLVFLGIAPAIGLFVLFLLFLKVLFVLLSVLILLFPIGFSTIVSRSLLLRFIEIFGFIIEVARLGLVEFLALPIVLIESGIMLIKILRRLKISIEVTVLTALFVLCKWVIRLGLFVPLLLSAGTKRIATLLLLCALPWIQRLFLFLIVQFAVILILEYFVGVVNGFEFLLSLFALSSLLVRVVLLG